MTNIYIRRVQTIVIMFGAAFVFVSLTEYLLWWLRTYKIRREARKAADRFVQTYDEYDSVTRFIDE